MRRYASILIVLMIALASCGGDSAADKRSSGTTTSGPTTTPTASAPASPQPSGNPLPSQDPTAGGLPQRPCDPRTDYSPNAGVPGQTYIRAVTTMAQTWGKGCEVLSPGDRCVVQWSGSYILLVGDEAHLTFQAWAKGQAKPFKEITAGPLPAEHQFRKAGFPVEIPSGTDEVAFRIVLRDATKTPVAISDAFAYRINCRPE